MKAHFTRKHLIIGSLSFVLALSVVGTLLFHHVFAAHAAPHVITPITVTTHTNAQGFDVCEPPPLSTMQTWWQSSPYRWVNIYIGGINRACPNGPSADWVASAYTMGWGLVPTYVGLQVPASCLDPRLVAATIDQDPTVALSQGLQAASDAANAAQMAGLNPGTIIYDDMEYYTGPCDAQVDAFLSGWDQGLHNLGYKAGVYMAGTNIGALQRATVVEPDAVWVVNSGFVASAPGYVPNCTVYGNAQLPDGAWRGHRLYQYLVNGGGHLDHPETWGGVTLPSIDSDCADGDIVGHAAPVDLGPNFSFIGHTSTGQVVMAMRAKDNNIWLNMQTLPNAQWTGWAPLAPNHTFTGDPVLGQEHDGRLLIVALGADGALWENEQILPAKGTPTPTNATDQRWTGWQVLQKDQHFTGTPAIARNANGTVEIVALGSDKTIWHDVQTHADGAWAGWQQLADANDHHTFTSPPSVAQNSDGRLEVFARSSDNNLWVNFQQAPNTQWFGWLPLQAKAPTTFQGTPASIRNVDGRLEVFVRGADNNLWHNVQKTEGGTWADWAPITTNFTFAGDPAVGQDTDGRLEVLARGTDNNMWLNFQVGPGNAWFGWQHLQDGFSFVGTPGITRNADGRLVAYALDKDGGLWYSAQQTPGGTWIEWVLWQTGLGLHQG